jgi:hypothetical protein
MPAAYDTWNAERKEDVSKFPTLRSAEAGAYDPDGVRSRLSVSSSSTSRAVAPGRGYEGALELFAARIEVDQ